MLLEHDRKLVVLIRRSAEALAEVVSNEASHQQPRLVMRRDHGIADMVRGMVVGNTSLSSTRWKRLASDSAPVLRCTPGAPHLPPRPLPLPQEERKGSVGGAGEQERWQFLTKWSYMHATSLMMITHGYIYDR